MTIPFLKYYGICDTEYILRCTDYIKRLGTNGLHSLEHFPLSTQA